MRGTGEPFTITPRLPALDVGRKVVRMPPREPAVLDPSVGEPTLATLLTRAVRTPVPIWLYRLLHLAFPLAIDFAYRGWWRPAIAAVAVTAFGAWGLADHWLWDASEEVSSRRPWAERLARLGRAVAGVVAGTGAALLLLELFLRVLGDPPGH